MATQEELQRRVEELAAQHAENTRTIRTLARRQKAIEACKTWQNTHRYVPGARFVIPHLFISGNKVTEEPSAEGLRQAQKFEKEWDKTIRPLLEGDD